MQPGARKQDETWPEPPSIAANGAARSDSAGTISAEWGIQTP